MPGRSTLVFGGTGSIGRAVCRALDATGYGVIIADLPDAIARQEDLPRNWRTVACDVTDRASVEAALEKVCNEVDAVVYASGVNYTGPVATTDWSAYERLQRVNLQGAFHVGAAAERILAPGAYVFLSSVAGLSGEAGGSVYCSTKFGLIGFVESFAAEIAERGARANSVCPGNVDSPLLASLAADVAARERVSTEEILHRFAAESAFNRLITVDEVAAVVSFLISPQSSGVSGQAIIVDGP
ncbi:SDR family NAD(P)-dependent oxidoreductase [Leucobacter aridicollis]|uniref:Ketoreductase domain-containing protein n=1 Tax=Leucobacter aridicollis TaxID=283878 RepID=A0A852RGU5_9MICO|nr:SDR family oxidoreductase [Leucobacter aridicollis]MBL3680917.1 SDR family oxidoreductase [Leucobacter aridicollis]NYD28080.1 hypothetical protein [Leucobacter aridicollis]